ncbi:MAG: homocitrate synthase/isopropylmalate synthase family protein [bacterium JZ-2024 1]
MPERDYEELFQQYYFDPRVFTDTSGFPPPEKIKLYDTTLRDGEQMPGVAFTAEQKLEIAVALSDIGIHILDVGFPGVSDTEKEALQKILQARKQKEIRPDLEILVMCRSNASDIDATINTLREVGAGPEEITFLIFTSASDLHIKYKLGPTLLQREKRQQEEWETLPIEFYRQANIRMVQDAIRYAKSRGVRYVEFGTEDASRSHVEYLITLVRAAIAAGADRYIFPDTTGSLTPDSTRFYVIRLKKALGKTPIVSHFHNDFDLATINVITAMSLGIEMHSVTVNGIGERAGNAPLHTVVTALKLLYGIEIPGFKYEKLWDLKKLVENYSGIPVKVNEPVIGLNTFAHESGIHTHGVLAHPRTYEPIPTEVVGGYRRLLFGKHTGSHLVEWALKKNLKILEEKGISLTPQLVEQVTWKIKAIREEKAKSGITREIIDQYYQNLAQLEMSEEDVVELAIKLGGVEK